MKNCNFEVGQCLCTKSANILELYRVVEANADSYKFQLIVFGSTGIYIYNECTKMIHSSFEFIDSALFETTWNKVATELREIVDQYKDFEFRNPELFVSSVKCKNPKGKCFYEKTEGSLSVSKLLNYFDSDQVTSSSIFISTSAEKYGISIFDSCKDKVDKPTYQEMNRKDFTHLWRNIRKEIEPLMAYMREVNRNIEYDSPITIPASKIENTELVDHSKERYNLGFFLAIHDIIFSRKFYNAPTLSDIIVPSVRMNYIKMAYFDGFIFRDKVLELIPDVDVFNSIYWMGADRVGYEDGKKYILEKTGYDESQVDKIIDLINQTTPDFFKLTPPQVVLRHRRLLNLSH